MEKIFQLPWQVPFGALSLHIDALNLVFLLAISILVVCAGIYGVGYMRPWRGKKPLAVHAAWFLVLTLALFTIVLANNVILFLGAYELMTLSTYFLIIFNDEKAAVRKAGFLYLIAAHCGTFLLFLMFFLMAHVAGSMNFDVIARTGFTPVVAGVIFCLAIFGFGVKAGFVPMHIWLPHAHPAAPSHVSALLSGVAIKMGIYGICRVLFMVAGFPDWCGYAMLLVGVVSGLMGVLYALGQHELKKLLAYHSIENIGIIALGLGLGLLGRTYHLPILSVLGFGGALLHVFNHSLFKGLLFLGAGAVIHTTHTGEMDKLGGLARTMPVTSTLFLTGALSICGLPLFNGFISEFIIFFGLFQGVLAFPLHGVVFCALGILSLALMGALALACFTKVYGTAFAGEPRTAVEASGHPGKEALSAWMFLPMLILALLCIWIGIAPAAMTRLTLQGGERLAHVPAAGVALATIIPPLSMIISSCFVFLALVLVLVGLRRLFLGATPMPVRETWRCGFFPFSPTFQYTSSSFARPIVDFVKSILLFRRHGGRVSGYFPKEAHMSSCVHDVSEEKVFRPSLAWLTGLSRKIDDKRIHYTQTYLMYIFLFLIFLLVWKLK